MLATLFGKKLNDEQLQSIKRVYGNALEKFPHHVINEAFNRAERECERFPTPKLLIAIAGELVPSRTWRYDFKKAKRPDPETGMLVPVLIDPDPGRGKDPVMYLPQDCPEGRAYLKKLEEIASR